MRERWAGPTVVVLILTGVMAYLGLNVRWKSSLPGSSTRPEPATSVTDSQPALTRSVVSDVRQPVGFREYPIGDDIEKNEMLIKAVWLPPVQMEGMEFPASSGQIHLEADIHATEANRNGFALGEFIPYLVIDYTIVPVGTNGAGKKTDTIRGELRPMVARDGMHYGATIEMPGDGHYQLIYAIKPPSAGGLGRHVDAATGVQAWWKAFEVSFDWDFRREG